MLGHDQKGQKNTKKFIAQPSDLRLLLWEAAGRSVDGRHEPTCGTFTNTCSSHWVRQLHADKVLVLRCSWSEPQKGFLPKRFNLPRRNEKTSGWLKCREVFGESTGMVGNTVGVSSYLWLLEYQAGCCKFARNIFASGWASNMMRNLHGKEKVLQSNVVWLCRK